MKYLGSSFSLQMIPEGGTIEVEAVEFSRFTFVSVDSGYSKLGGYYITETPDFHSVVGHEGTAKALTAMIGHTVEVNRGAITLKEGDRLYVAQPTGQRIEYGKELDFPELKFYKVGFHHCPPLGSFSTEQLERELKYRSGELEAEAELRSLENKPQSEQKCPSCGSIFDDVIAMKVAIFGDACPRCQWKGS